MIKRWKLFYDFFFTVAGFRFSYVNAKNKLGVNQDCIQNNDEEESHAIVLVRHQYIHTVFTFFPFFRDGRRVVLSRNYGLLLVIFFRKLVKIAR